CKQKNVSLREVGDHDTIHDRLLSYNSKSMKNRRFHNLIDIEEKNVWSSWIDLLLKKNLSQDEDNWIISAKDVYITIKFLVAPSGLLPPEFVLEEMNGNVTSIGDTFLGWGGILIGTALAAKIYNKKLSYTGTDVRLKIQQSMMGVQHLTKNLNAWNPKKAQVEFNLHDEKAEAIDLEKKNERFDLVIFDPPYGNGGKKKYSSTEIYPASPNLQSANCYTDPHDWLDNFMLAAAHNWASHLTKSGRFILIFLDDKNHELVFTQEFIKKFTKRGSQYQMEMVSIKLLKRNISPKSKLIPIITFVKMDVMLRNVRQNITIIENKNKKEKDALSNRMQKIIHHKKLKGNKESVVLPMQIDDVISPNRTNNNSLRFHNPLSSQPATNNNDLFTNISLFGNKEIDISLDKLSNNRYPIQSNANNMLVDQDNDDIDMDMDTNNCHHSSSNDKKGTNADITMNTHPNVTDRSSKKNNKKRIRKKDAELNKYFTKLPNKGGYECKTCKKIIKNKRSTNDHTRRHTGEKPFQCEYCQKKFARSFTLTNHKKIHTGEKPYQCQYCHKKFTQSGNRNDHERRHTGEKPFQCQYCQKKFVTSQEMENHQKRIHK
ncbi:MAG: C2H2-type zinc finger protein, partial [Pseudomonadota bacterium]